MPSKPTPPGPAKPLHERLFGDERAKKRKEQMARDAANAAGRVISPSAKSKMPAYLGAPKIVERGA